MSKELMEFGPDKKYLQKRQLVAFMWFFFSLIIVLGTFLGLYFGGDNKTTALIVLFSVGGVVVVWYILWAIYLSYYYKSMIYQLKENEMIVQRGVFNKIEKNVPFRAVTNLAVFRSLFDRMFGIGTIRLHTAGYSGTPLPEENIEGLVNYQEVYDKLIAKIRPLQAMTPRASVEVEEQNLGFQEQLRVNQQILATLQEIKELLKQE
ncbi:MAG: PH domain-containing protein [Candidatus Heimdallarchaeota archaeon]